ncbi:hypothetical protein PP939_gp083 [Rhizobium phage RL38J1]|uniref:Uncharacterized protein n=1 Tax=Rhizobium phage RL38J1 TaxID=2663232 RepID=A0A6B9J334_9CAUD|nr:hypothetical protein PP939_gp083 [Rhizobium phage RL38J1]QGZ14093.1 hypothetical protein RL38J1_083 [Rhizobium phage RL38J1]
MTEVVDRIVKGSVFVFQPGDEGKRVEARQLPPDYEMEFVVYREERKSDES